MLDTQTKRRIDTARDILVGKVPDPKSQVEQITIALIYKFMWDIDAQSEELGGERSFFVGEFDRYGWPKLMHAGLGGHDTLYLYAEALDRIPQNPGIPPLFRGIFNNAYLPYRDPETLRAFLKVIDEFEYDHSERLGDAFEYLLSVMGAQGDAGQFRTPRHIIDFIVAVIDPKKHETVLDPACGTAGFLISSYKHILAANTDEHGHGTLTPDERGRLAENFTGYDISPDMVRLSLVNMYLHGFADPRIHEYDTLTNEERWSQRADVILANPPFMSPKGGIRPHNRFSITSKRSEVLFVDYMAEHLTPAGRAGIIVPEGIIFQSQKAHTQLRKLLVEEYLVAVVSLPAGVFKPYSGVKTSILILDRALARRTDRIAFFKVENDGFDLGDQRRPIDQNDLPDVEQAVKEYLNMDGQDIQEREKKSCPSRLSMLNSLIDQGAALIVDKGRIAADGDYNLSGERYRDDASRKQGVQFVVLGDTALFRVESGGTPKSSVEDYWDGGVPWATLVDLPPTDFITEITSTRRTLTERGLRESSAKLIPENSVVVSTRATLGRIAINRVPMATNQGFKNIVVEDHSRAIPEYVALAMTRLVPTMQAWASGGTFKELSKSRFCELEIPLPPLEVQQEIVAEIEGYQKVINGARAVIDNYYPRIPIDPEWPVVTIAEVAELFIDGDWVESKDQSDSGIRLIQTGNIGIGQYLDKPLNSRFISNDTFVKLNCTEVFPGDVLISRLPDPVGRSCIAPDLGMRAITAVDCSIVRLKECQFHPKVFVAITMSHFWFANIAKYLTGSTRPRISRSNLGKVKIPLPPIDTQRALIREIEAEQSLVTANQQLIDRFERKVQAAISRVWGDDASRIAA